jgi:nucleoside-diphosphate-sugar epimerase
VPNVLILGGTVFVGKHTVAAFQQAGWTVSILNRGKTAGDLAPGVERLVADRTKPEELAAVLTGRNWDAVVDVSGFVMVAGSPTDAVGPLLDLLDGNTGRYIFVSSIMANQQVGWMPWTEDYPRNPDPSTTYGGFKVAVENEVLRRFADHGFPGCAVRPAAIYGPDNNIFDMETPMFLRLLHHRPILLPHEGLVSCNYGHVDDLADAIVRLATHPAAPGEIFNVSAEAVTTRHYVHELASIVGRDPNIVEVPAKAVAKLPAKPLPYGHLFAARHHGVISIDKIDRLCGITPSFDFRRGHENTYDWFKAQGWSSPDLHLKDPVWGASWDFDLEARVVEQLRDGTL